MPDTLKDAPSCWDADYSTYLQQLSAEELTFTTAHGWCTDCTPAYKTQMILEGRCAFVSTKFYIASVADLPNTRAGILYVEHRLIGIRAGADPLIVARDGPTQLLALREVEGC